MAGTIDLFAPGTPTALALLASRVGGLVMVAPVFSARPIPGTVRTALVVLLTVLIFPVAQRGPGLAITPASVLGETLIGFTVGLGAALLIGAAEVAGEYVSVQIGLSGAALMDPLSHQQTAALGSFLQVFAITLLLSMNGHITMLDAVAATARRIPLGASLSVPTDLGELVAMGGTLFSLGARFAAPVIAVALIANVALAVLSRAAPQLNILQLAFPVQILVGLAALLVVLPAMASWMSGWEGPFDGLLTRALTALTGGTR